MIKIIEDYLLNNINTIIKENKNYGKINIGNHKKINISLITNNKNDCLDIDYIREITYIDNLERILTFTGYNVTKELYIIDSNDLPNDLLNKYQNNFLLNTKYNFIKKELDNYRTNFNLYLDKSILYEKNLMEDILTKLRYTDSCYINENTLYLRTIDNQDIMLIDNNGNYTTNLENITYHINRLNNNYDNLLDVIKSNTIDTSSILASLNILEYNSKILNIKNLSSVKINKENIATLSKLIDTIGINATRYFFSKKTIDKDIEIDIELALDESNNNPIYYIENTYAKICSILESFKNKINCIDNDTTLNTKEAYNMLNKLYEFKNVVKKSSEFQEPYFILEYILELVTLFNSYYEQEKLNNYNSIYTQEKLNLLSAVKIVLNNALDLIGIIPKEQM